MVGRQQLSLPDAKGALIGMTRDTGKSHIAHACLDGIALSIHDLVETFTKETQTKIQPIRVDGGASTAQADAATS